MILFSFFIIYDYLLSLQFLKAEKGKEEEMTFNFDIFKIIEHNRTSYISIWTHFESMLSLKHLFFFINYLDASLCLNHSFDVLIWILYKTII